MDSSLVPDTETDQSTGIHNITFDYEKPIFQGRNQGTIENTANSKTWNVLQLQYNGSEIFYLVVSVHNRVNVHRYECIRTWLF
jgi:hypothetical protein